MYLNYRYLDLRCCTSKCFCCFSCYYSLQQIFIYIDIGVILSSCDFNIFALHEIYPKTCLVDIQTAFAVCCLRFFQNVN